MQLIPLFEQAEAITLPAPAVPAKEASLEEKVSSAIAVIKEQILAGKRLAIASSFGKDSSATLALALTAMVELVAEGVRVPELHVMNSNTRLENPVVDAYAKGEIKKLKAYATEKGLPVRVWVCSPSLASNYLVGIIGGRSVASLPGNDAKCQQDMKAQPLERTKRQIAKLVKAELGAAFTPDTLITLIGTRRDESAARGRAMSERGESAIQAVNLGADKGINHWVLSPIAEFSEWDVYGFIAEFTNGRRRTYSDFKLMMEVYRDSAGGECAVNIMLRGEAPKKTACGARHGCWVCLRVQSDRSMANLLEDDKYAWMKPLNDFRNYIGNRHYDASARNYLARTVNPDTGRIQISPNSYSPDFCLELLRYALSIDADEQEWAYRNDASPRFQLLGLQEVLAIDVLFARYGYQPPFTALQEYRDIFENGARYRIPTDAPAFERKDISFNDEIQVPFADEHYDSMFSGLRDLQAATADAERLVVKKNGVLYSAFNTDVEFGIDLEGAQLFIDFELDNILKEYGPSSGVAPSAAIHIMARYGFLLVKKGAESEWDRMMRMSNQIHRHGLKHLLNKPAELAARLRELFNDDDQDSKELCQLLAQDVRQPIADQLDLFKVA